MLKKWLHILLSVWLINSVAFPQINDVPQIGHHCTNSSELNVDNWADFILQSLAADKSVNSDQHHHTKYHRRYVHANAHRLNAYLATNHFIYLPYNYAKKVVKRSISPYLIGVAILPAYYNFLFRLSPF